MLHHLGQHSSILTSYVSEIRSLEIQQDPLRFRTNLERIAEVLCYELSKCIPSIRQDVRTPLGTAQLEVPAEDPVLVTILRAGLAMHQGVLRCFDRADSAFVSAYRKHNSPEDFDIQVEYLAAPSLDQRTWVISDPMLATGSSMVAVYKALLKIGTPTQVHIVSAIATPQAIAFVQSQLPTNTQIWVAAIDPELTAQSYIVPGLGDAGDLAYGIKR
ncbi:MAG: hypothetical protein RLZZ301_198 [Bacteroidota bacterium]|jgi:uracil phosphoribosyltransferase